MQQIQSSWFMKHRPKKVEDYVFESDLQKQQALKWIEQGFIDGNVIMHGPAGTGKSVLAELLIRSVIKNQQDVNIIKSRSVNVIDELEPWMQKRPISSKQKIVYIEEMDRLSRQAIGTLKDTLMEKFQEYVTFICTTNYLNRIDRAVQTRFTHKYNLTCSNRNGVIERLKSILVAESVQFDENQLLQFVTSNAKVGLRDLINNIQVNTQNGQINFQNIILQKSEQEEDVIKNTMAIFQFLGTCKDVNAKRMCIVSPMDSEIAPFYSSLLEIIQYNMDLDYTSVFLQIEERIHFLPLKLLINKYLGELEMKKMPHIHFLAFLYDAMKAIIEIVL